MATKALIPIKPRQPSPARDGNDFRVTWERGRLVIEVPTVIRVPIDFEAISSWVLNKLKLTPRERQTLDGILRGLQNKEIAAQLNITERTVKYFVSELLAKFGVAGRAELVSSLGGACSRAGLVGDKGDH